MPPPLPSPSQSVHFFGRAKPPLRELAQRVGGDRDGRAEHHLADVDGDVRRGVHRLGELRRGRGDAALPLRAVAVELQVREMHRQCRRPPRSSAARCRRFPAAPRLLQWTCSGCGTPSAVHRLLQGEHDLARGDAVDRAPRRRRRRSRTFDLKAAAPPALITLTPSPCPAAERRRDIVLHSGAAPSRSRIMPSRKSSLPRTSSSAAVDDRRQRQLDMRVQRVARIDRRLDHQREAHLGVEPAVLEGRQRRGRSKSSSAPLVPAAVLLRAASGGPCSRCRWRCGSGCRWRPP